MKTVKVTCEGCGTQIDRIESEVKRNQKKGLRVFCSISCQAKHANNGKGDISRFNGKKGIQRDQYSPFREHLKRAGRRGTQRKRRQRQV